MPCRRPVSSGDTRNKAWPLGLAIGLAARLAVAADVPVIGLAQEDADGRTALPRIAAGTAQEPLLAFELALSARCPASTPRPEIVISIADTTRIVTSEAQRQALALEVPLGQLQWLATPTETCALIGGKREPERVEESGERVFRLHAITAAFATLVCTAADGRATATSTAAPMDAWLACPAADTPR